MKIVSIGSWHAINWILNLAWSIAEKSWKTTAQDLNTLRISHIPSRSFNVIKIPSSTQLFHWSSNAFRMSFVWSVIDQRNQTRRPNSRNNVDTFFTLLSLATAALVDAIPKLQISERLCSVYWSCLFIWFFSSLSAVHSTKRARDWIYWIDVDDKRQREMRV